MCCKIEIPSMHEIDLMSIGSYTELPGGNIALPQVLILETIHYHHYKETIHYHHYKETFHYHHYK